MRLMRILVGLGGFMLAAVPGTAFAHDNLGGDELAVANWMLVGAMVTIVLGILAGLWAMKSGQFSNIEDSKYTMLDTAEDYDAIMAAADERERAARTSAKSAEQPTAKSPATAEPAVANVKQHQAHI
jgi:nitrogen fixation-related uncharacterized protein